ncbi:hypothetical protein [Sporosarcina quadrami]|nr:hypothetical protein [Sporosarcina quadrami]
MSIIKPLDILSIHQSYMTFLMPFSYNQSEKKSITEKLEQNSFTYFRLNETEKHKNTKAYGEHIKVEVQELEQYFFPYVEHKLFPASITERGFHRFTKVVNENFQFEIHESIQTFIVRSIDVILAPFGIAFLSLRTELEQDKELSDILEFAQHFRAVESRLDENKGSKVIVSTNSKKLSVHDFIFKHLCPYLKPVILQDKKLKGYFGSLPYIEDERMFVTSFLLTEVDATIEQEHLFRIGNLNGKTPEGQPFISSTNPAYIKQSLSDTLHDRWAPELYMLTTDHAFSTISNRSSDELTIELSHYMGTHYYNLLLHYYYKIMLLRMSFEYSEIEWKKDEYYVKSLIKLITLFSSWYYFLQISTRTEGKELAALFRKSFNLDCLYNEVSGTLQQLYKSQENSRADRVNTLLFILTIFTVISGIYGMNLVISDWEAPSGWKKYTTYTVFEWISLITAVTGIGLSGYLIFNTFGRMFIQKIRSLKRTIDVE